MTIKKILVTGSSGTIGTRLCETLLAQKYTVIGADIKANRWNKTIDKLTIRVDLRDKKQVLKKLPKDVDIFIHLAANARVYNLVKDPQLARDNFEMLFHVLEFARINHINRVIFSSSREVYGNHNKIKHSEDESYVKHCESPYTASKIGGEALIHSYHQCYGMDFLIFRFSNVYGMYDDSDRLIPLFIDRCRKNQDLKVFGKDKLLDFTYIDDTIAGIIRGVKKFNTIKNEVFNLAYGQGTSILKVAQLMKKNIGSNNKIIMSDNRTGEVVKYIADITKAKNKLGYQPQTNITHGIQNAIAWYDKNFY